MPPDRTEPIAVSVARLQETMEGLRDDVSEIKAVQEAFVERFDHRVSYLEDIRVKALEDREIRRDAIADERARSTDAAKATAEEAARQVSEHTGRRIGSRQFWIGIAVTAVVAIVAALISSHHLF